MDDFICVVIVHVSSHEESNKDSSLFKKNTSNVLTDFFSGNTSERVVFVAKSCCWSSITRIRNEKSPILTIFS